MAVGVTSLLDELEEGTGKKYELVCTSCSAVGGVDEALSIERVFKCVGLCFPFSLYLDSDIGGGVDACFSRYRAPLIVGATMEESEVLSPWDCSFEDGPTLVGITGSGTLNGISQACTRAGATTDRHSISPLGFFGNRCENITVSGNSELLFDWIRRRSPRQKLSRDRSKSHVVGVCTEKLKRAACRCHCQRITFGQSECESDGIPVHVPRVDPHMG